MLGEIISQSVGEIPSRFAEAGQFNSEIFRKLKSTMKKLRSTNHKSSLS